MEEFLKSYWEGVIAGLALLVSTISTIVAHRTFKLQRTHNVKMIKPIIQIGQWDYENKLRIDLRNNGLGPAHVDKISVYKNEHEVKTCIYHWLPDKLPGDMNYKEYWTAHEKFIVQVNSIIKLIEIPVDIEIKKQVKCREEIRSILRQIKIKIEYSDLYGNEMETYEKSFGVFNRTDNEN
jgi:hypothetical protein